MFRQWWWLRYQRKVLFWQLICVGNMGLFDGIFWWYCDVWIFVGVLLMAPELKAHRCRGGRFRPIYFKIEVLGGCVWLLIGWSTWIVLCFCCWFRTLDPILLNQRINYWKLIQMQRLVRISVQTQGWSEVVFTEINILTMKTLCWSHWI